MNEKVTREKIILISEQIINQAGYDALNLTKVAKALGIRTPSLYNHISGLNELRTELKRYAFQQLKDRIVTATVGRSGRQALRALGLAYIQFMNDRPGLFEAALNPVGQTDPAIQKETSAILDIILRILKPYPLSEEQAIHFVRGIRALAYGFGALERQRGFNIDIPLNKSIILAFDTYLEGLPDMPRPIL